jgi:hypothetical protein
MNLGILRGLLNQCARGPVRWLFLVLALDIIIVGLASGVKPVAPRGGEAERWNGELGGRTGLLSGAPPH